jgi:hypothetical protein
MPKRVIAVITALVVVAGVILFSGPLFEKRTRIGSVATPAPVAEVAPIRVRAGGEVCARRVLLSPRTQVAQLVADRHEGTTPVTVVASGRGYRAEASGTIQGEGQQGVYADLTPPEQELLGRLCVRNTSDEPVSFVGTREFRTMTRAITSVDGRDVEPDLALTFFTKEELSVAGELGTIVDRMEIDRGFLGHGWILWFVLVLAFVGVPVVTGIVVFRALSDDR